MSPTSWNSEDTSTEQQRRPNFDLSSPFRVSEMSPASASVSATTQKRSYPISHAAADAPICIECQALEMTFYDPNCQGCRAELERPNVGIPHVMAILRQWVPQVQLSVEFLIEEALRRGAHPDDRDSVTDMTLLMFAVKSGACGVGDPAVSNRVVKQLLDLGASLDLRCRWTQMTPLHYAAFFDAAPIITTLLMVNKGVDVDTTCEEFENGSALHIAAANLSVEAAKALISFGADLHLTDDLARKPYECIPEEMPLSTMSSLTSAFSTDDEASESIAKLKVLLSTTSGGLDAFHRTFGRDDGTSKVASNSKASVSGRSVMRALGLKIGDRVIVGGSKLGTLHFCGTTDFAAGIWAGVELDQPEGKHDGTVEDVTYFVCAPDRGVFVQPNKISKVGKYYKDPAMSASQTLASSAYSRPPMTKVNHGKVDISRVSSRLTEAIAVIAERAEIRVGDQVMVAGLGGKQTTSCPGVVRFVGAVDFVDDDSKWYGVELDEPLGRHDGTVAGVRYFAANVDRGIFVTESKLTKIGRASIDQGRQAIKEAMTSSTDNFSDVTYADVDDVQKRRDVEQTDAIATNDKPARAAQRPLRRSLSMQHREQNKINNAEPNDCTTSTAAATTTTTTMPSKDPSPRSVLQTPASPVPSTSKSVRSSTQASTPMTSLSPSWQSVGAVQFNKFQMKRSPGKKFLEAGDSVICIHNKEMAVVKYVGRADFGPGIWLGLELRSPKGKHDGMVEGRRYFTCKSNHGIMIRPNRVSVHGINGEQLLKPESEYPF